MLYSTLGPEGLASHRAALSVSAKNRRLPRTGNPTRLCWAVTVQLEHAAHQLSPLMPWFHPFLPIAVQVQLPAH